MDEAWTQLRVETEWRLYVTPERGWNWEQWREKALACGTILEEHPQEGFFLMVRTDDVAWS